MPATLSILGLYQYRPDIFDGFHVPEQIDKDTLINEILLECAELELVYASLPFMQAMIDRWSMQMLPVWNRIVKAVNIEYNPLENYDRIEEWTDDDSSESESHDNSTSNSAGTNSMNDNTTSTSKVSAFNDTAFVNRAQDTTENVNNSTTNTDMRSNATATAVNNSNSTHSGRTHGNIGVTTSQQMLQSELDIAHKLDIYSIIAEDFKCKFCILVY